jgi:hypothetical protein
MAYGTGNPVGAPDFKPLNPWGRPMPKRERPPPPPLHQVVVKENASGVLTPVSPRMPKEHCEAFCEAISLQIVAGAEKRWSDPHVVKV